MSSTTDRWTVIFLFVITTSCIGCQENPREDQRHTDAEAVEFLNNATNVTTRNEMPSNKSTNSGETSIDENSIELLGSDLLFRKVNFDIPIDNRSSIYFSETEVTNKMYAKYLAETQKTRDDSELEAASKLRPFSTAARFVSIHDIESLWNENQVPEGREAHPVSLLSYDQINEFCEWIEDKYELHGTVRLPTQAEWIFAAYGSNRKYPWGDEEMVWSGKSTEPVKSHPELRTPEGLYGMWGNVTELVLSPSNGYGGTIQDIRKPFITCWQGPSYRVEKDAGKPPQPRQDYWGYTHSPRTVSDDMGFRIVFVPDDLPVDSSLEVQVIGKWQLNSDTVISTLFFKRDKTFSATRTDQSKNLSESQEGHWGVDSVAGTNWILVDYGVSGKIEGTEYSYHTSHPYQVVSPSKMISGSGEVFDRFD